MSTYMIIPSHEPSHHHSLLYLFLPVLLIPPYAPNHPLPLLSNPPLTPQLNSSVVILRGSTTVESPLSRRKLVE